MVKKDSSTLNLIEKSKTIGIICGPYGDATISGSIAMSAYIEEVFGKKVEVFYSGDYTNINPELLELKDVKSKFSQKSLKLSLDFSGTDIKTIDYYRSEDSRLVLEISPVNDHFDKERVEFELSGANYDLLILIGVHELNDLGDFYTKNKEIFENTKIINIDISDKNRNYGKINIVDFAHHSLAALFFAKFLEWGYVPSKKASKSLLIGLSE